MKNRFTLSRLNILALLVTASLFLHACSLGGDITSGGDGTHIWLDQPLTGYALPSAPFTLIAHASHVGGGISQVTFQVNGVAVGAVPADTGLEFVRAETTWNPSVPGEYTIQAQAITPGGMTVSDIAYVCVLAGIAAPVYGYSENCVSTTSSPFVPPPSETSVLPPVIPLVPSLTPFVPTITPFVPTSAPFIPSVTPFIPTVTPIPADTTPPSITDISTNPPDFAYYMTGCGPNNVFVQANVTDSSGVASVYLNYQYSGGSTHSIAMSNSGGSSYAATIDVGAEGYGNLNGLTGTLTISIQATDQLSNTTSVNWGGSVSIQYCPG